MAALAPTTVAVEYEDLSVAKVRTLPSDTVKAFRAFVRGPPFALDMHGYALRHNAVGTADAKRVLNDSDVDAGWLAACNRHMMRMDHRDAILLYDYTSFQYNASLRADGNKNFWGAADMKWRVLDMKREADMFDLADMVAPAPQFGHPGVWILLKLLSMRDPGTEPAFRTAARELFAAPLADGVLLALWEMARDSHACSYEFDREKHRRTAFRTVMKLRFAQTCTWGNLSRAGKRRVQRVVQRNMAAYWDAHMSASFRFAFQLLDLLTNGAGDHGDEGVPSLFHEMPSNVAARFERDMRAFHETTSLPTKFQLFMRYRFYFRFNDHFPRVVEAATARMEGVFAAMPPLRAPLVVYRGIQDRKWMRQTTWYGLTSTTLSAPVAKGYIRGKGCCFLRMHVPAGARIIPNMGLTAGIGHMELLLPHRTKVRTRRGHSRPVHVPPYEWPHETSLEEAFVAYDVDVILNE